MGGSFRICLMGRLPETATLFPYTTLFRSPMVEAAPDEVPVERRLFRYTLDAVERESVERKTADPDAGDSRSEEHTSELQSLRHLVCRLQLEKKKISLISSSIIWRIFRQKM